MASEALRDHVAVATRVTWGESGRAVASTMTAVGGEPRTGTTSQGVVRTKGVEDQSRAAAMGREWLPQKSAGRVGSKEKASPGIGLGAVDEW